MDKQEIVKFLDEHKDLPPDLRSRILAHHAGLRPTWNVTTMQRVGTEIQVVGTWNFDRPHKRVHIALRWCWSKDEIGLCWQTFDKASQAAELKISIDSPRVIFKRSGLRPD